ncbi:transcriptional regulator [Pigmentiphaga sp. CHJ604]|uniref:helix-turn-helix transcriptional regulator n=1 Tax=Pigmentiphaga sp. CHJ604 TaxID=3081984 RepID=UPI0030D3544F
MKRVDTKQAAKARRRSEPRRIEPEGQYRWGDFEHLVPFSRETWRLRVKEGRAPQPKRLGLRATVYPGKEVLRWLAAPDQYRVQAATDEGNQAAGRTKGITLVPFTSLSR